jgi:excisionase family DNA binding protein
LGESEYPDVMTIEQTAEYLQLSSKTIRRLISRKELKASKITSVWRIKKDDIIEYLNQNLNK